MSSKLDFCCCANVYLSPNEGETRQNSYSGVGDQKRCLFYSEYTR